MSKDVLDYIKERSWSLQVAWEEARTGVEIPDDEHFESDEYYRGAIDVLREVLKEFGEIKND